MKPRVGFVGIGNIGEPVVRHLLQAGYEVLVHDARVEAVSRLDGTPAEPVGDLKELASAADAVLLFLPNSTVVEEVVLGKGSLVEESLTSATAWSSASKKKDAAVPRSHSPSCRRVVIP